MLTLSQSLVCNIKTYIPKDEIVDVETCPVKSQPKCVIDDVWTILINNIMDYNGTQLNRKICTYYLMSNITTDTN
jgi:hypothetical protein